MARNYDIVLTEFECHVDYMRVTQYRDLSSNHVTSRDAPTCHVLVSVRVVFLARAMIRRVGFGAA